MNESADNQEDGHNEPRDCRQWKDLFSDVHSYLLLQCSVPTLPVFGGKFFKLPFGACPLVPPRLRAVGYHLPTNRSGGALADQLRNALRMNLVAGASAGMNFVVSDRLGLSSDWSIIPVRCSLAVWH